MGTIITELIAKKVAGEAIGLLASKTQWGATSITGAALWAAVPRALNGDPEAVGQVVLAVVGWLLALYGRWKAGK